MSTEQKQTEQTEQKLNEELSFSDKERDCEECDKEKEVQLSFGLSTREEWDKVMLLIKKYGLSRDEINYIYGFYNRELKEKKSPGCGKCFYNLCKNLEKRYKTLINEGNNG
jgi:flagellar motility protein MotE (MotC chaperone)